jgi:glycine/D-amino acid oxidase-like deaminating enzyme
MFPITNLQLSSSTLFTVLFIMLVKRSFSALLKRKEGKVAIIGGGLGGLGAASQLSELFPQIDMYDPFGPGESSASSIAGGLLHPFSPKGKILWSGVEGFEETMQLAEKLKSITDVPKHMINQETSIIRPIFEKDDLKNWKETASIYPNSLELGDPTDYARLLGFEEQLENLLNFAYLKQSAIIYTPLYLQLLWRFVQSKSSKSTWIKQVVPNLDILKNQYDVIVIASGYTSPIYFPNHNLHVRFIEGKNLHYSSDNLSLNHGVLSGEYLVPRPHLHNTICGTSHEHKNFLTHDAILDYYNGITTAYSTSDIFIKQGQEKLLSRCQKFYPIIHENIPVQHVSSGVRLATTRTNMGRLPIVGRHLEHENVWIISGFGSRGLLYHALMAKYLAAAIEHNQENGYIPESLWPTSHLKYQKSNKQSE